MTQPFKKGTRVEYNGSKGTVLSDDLFQIIEWDHSICLYDPYDKYVKIVKCKEVVEFKFQVNDILFNKGEVVKVMVISGLWYDVFLFGTGTTTMGKKYIESYWNKIGTAS